MTDKRTEATIKTPVRYNDEYMEIFDNENVSIASFDIYDDERAESHAEQFCTAINEHADLVAEVKSKSDQIGNLYRVCNEKLALKHKNAEQAATIAAMGEEVAAFREMLAVTPCINFGGCLIDRDSTDGTWSAKNQFKWHWKGRCIAYPTALDAFAALKTDPDAWFEIDATLNPQALSGTDPQEGERDAERKII